MEEELGINLNNHDHNFQSPIIIEDINITVDKEKDNDVNHMNIIITDNSDRNYIAHVLMVFPNEDNIDTPNILWIHLIDEANNNMISLTYHWFKDCLFEQALKKANLTIEEFVKLFMEERQYELEVAHRLRPKTS